MLLFNFRLHWFTGKLCPMVMSFQSDISVLSGDIELKSQKGKIFKVNSQHVRQYLGVSDKVNLMEMVYLDKI